MKIQMKTPLVELDGDEMTRIIWAEIKKTLLEPFIDLKTEYYDLGLKNREATKDKITVEAAEAIKRLGVGVKCATITPNAERVKEYNLSEMWKSPNATIRSILDGTVFRSPIIANGISPLIPLWKKPITIARHAYGDVYGGVEAYLPEGGKVELALPDGSKKTVAEIEGGFIVQGTHNTDKSIRSFARSSFNYALSRREDLWFSAKDTISKIYDRRFRDVFGEVYNGEFKEKFASAGINYFYTLIDDAVARIMRSEGGFVWATKNYDGDVMSDMLATVFGSLAMMTSVLVSPDGNCEFEAAHGTVTRHYYRYLKGEETSTNPAATLFAWTGALKKRAELDNLKELADFSSRLENAALDTIAEGVMTKDLPPLFKRENVVPRGVSTKEFLNAVGERL
jgi:isocitrate dehydrogenase, NADP-dependent, eukaryotic type